MRAKTKKQLMWGTAALGAIYFWQKKKADKYPNGAPTGSGMEAFMSEVGAWAASAGGGEKLSAAEMAALRTQLLPGVTNKDIEKYASGAATEPSGYTEQDLDLIEQALVWD